MKKIVQIGALISLLFFGILAFFREIILANSLVYQLLQVKIGVDGISYGPRPFDYSMLLTAFFLVAAMLCMIAAIVLEILIIVRRARKKGGIVLPILLTVVLLVGVGGFRLIPPQMLSVSQYLLFSRLHMIDTSFVFWLKPITFLIEIGFAAACVLQLILAFQEKKQIDRE